MELPLHLAFLIFLLLIPLALRFKIMRACTKPETEPTILPPSPSPLPIIGHLHYLVGAALPHHALRDLSLRLGPIMLLRLGRIDHVVVSSRNAAEDVLRTHDISFASRPALHRLKSFTYGYTDVALCSYTPLWRQLRKICVMELFTARRVASFSALREEEVSSMVDAISAAAVGGKAEVNLRMKLQELTNNIVTRAAFSWEDRLEQKRSFLRMMEEMFQLASGFSLADLFPGLEFVDVVTGVKKRIDRHFRGFYGILDEIIGEHEEKARRRKESVVAEEEKRLQKADDLVDVLLRMRDEGNLEVPITTENIKSVIVDLFFAGTDSSAATVHWALSELMRSPEIMQKAQREIRQAAKGKAKLEESDLADLTYLKQIIKETLRLHPPLPLLLPRLCRETCRVQGYTVHAGARVVVNAWALGRDPAVWERAEMFWPERFEVKLVDYSGDDFDLLPFGAGRRKCAGIKFGIANVELPLAQLLHCFDWELLDGARPEEVDMTEVHGMTAGRKKDLCLIATPRFHLPVS